MKIKRLYRGSREPKLVLLMEFLIQSFMKKQIVNIFSSVNNSLSHSFLPLRFERRHKQYVNEWVWLFSQNNYSQKLVAQFWPLDHNLLTHWTRGKTDMQKIMRKFSKVAGYKITIQKLVAFLCTSNREKYFFNYYL